ncbi:MAG: phosphate ABC transporter ATP-binding protein PstB [Deltaproteobacteria bacterium]|jgi:phosphate transport system ATP-binding protein|nr:phosphate ABC transporter ATP-binding protein PstB [Deltaproteobacteria bacterium]
MENHFHRIKIKTQSLDFYYGSIQALKYINLEIKERQITALIGPSGCGKSTFLRTLNRMNELLPRTRVSGTVLLDGMDIYAPEVNPVNLRQRVGMVFQRPNPFPRSIFENVAFGPKVLGTHRQSHLGETVEKSLKGAALWEEVADRLQDDATGLSLGQQQRLCIARVLAMQPEVILMDEPCSALDPQATLRIEELMQELKKNYTIVIVTHNMQQAARASDWVGFFLLGELLEYGATKDVFTNPKDQRTESYITGRYG